MSQIRIIHILKRIESIQESIQELHSLSGLLKSNKEYSSPLKIAIELQVNSLLNEKIKLVDLPVERVPQEFQAKVLYPNLAEQDQNILENTESKQPQQDNHAKAPENSLPSIYNELKTAEKQKKEDIPTSFVQSPKFIENSAKPSPFSSHQEHENLEKLQENSIFNNNEAIKTLQNLKKMMSSNVSREELLSKVPQANY